MQVINKRGQHKRKNQRSLILIGILCIVMICTFVFFLHHTNKEVQAGQAYVVAQEKKSTSALKPTLEKKRQAEMSQAMAEGKLNVFSMFDDYVFFGDSRVMGFETYGYLDANRVLGDSGGTIKRVDDHLNEIKSLKPTRVYLSYGMNDMGLKINDEQGGYAGVYETEVKKILAIVPNAKIYVCSIIPCSPEALQKSSSWGQVGTYNQQLKAMCKKNKWTYINCTKLADNGNADIYQSDGIHFLTSFYPVWAQTIIDATQKAES